MYSTILLDKTGRIATITLNRPERLNAVNEAMRQDMIAAMDELEEDDGIHVVILKGAGRAFCVGADVHDAGVVGSGSELHPGDTSEDWSRAQKAQRWLFKVWDLPKPVISQIHGYCLGMGTMLMTVSDLVLAAEDAKFGNARIFMGAGMIGPRYVWGLGLRRAKWLDFLPGWRVTGKEAEQWGWINMALPADKLNDEVQALAEQLAMVPLTHLKFRKVSMNRVWEQWGFRHSVAAGIDFDPLAHKSNDGLQVENRVGAEGFIKLGGDLYTRFPARHGHA